MPGKIPLQTVCLNNTSRPLFNRSFFSALDEHDWELWLEDSLVHVLDKRCGGVGHGIVHISSCTVEVKPGVDLPKKPRRGRPPKRRPVEVSS